MIEDEAQVAAYIFALQRAFARLTLWAMALAAFSLGTSLSQIGRALGWWS